MQCPHQVRSEGALLLPHRARLSSSLYVLIRWEDSVISWIPVAATNYTYEVNLQDILLQRVGC